MFTFVESADIPTPTSEELGDNAKFLRLSPFIYFGHYNGHTEEQYSPLDQYTLKQFRVQVASANYQTGLLNIDCIDLYDNLDTSVDSAINGIGSDSFLNASKACPVKFRRVHFLAHRGNGQDAGEYFSIFLMGKAAPIDQSSTDYSNTLSSKELTPGYAGSDGEYSERLIIGSDTPSTYAFKISLLKIYENETVDIRVRGGSAQALGQSPFNYEDKTFEGVSVPIFFYIEYNLESFEWGSEIQSSATFPTADENKYIVIIGAYDSLGVRQDRAGAIEIVITDNQVDVS